MRRISITVVNVLGSYALALFTTWVGTYLLCSKCYIQEYVWFGAGSVFLVSLVFFWTQFNKTRQFLRPKKRAFPLLSINRKTFNNVFKSIWEPADGDNDNNDIIRNVGWHVAFEDDVPVIVKQREYFYWLVRICDRQKELTKDNKLKVRSPISQRENPDLGRRTLRAYKFLLSECNALEYLNSNVYIIKPEYLDDPWEIVKLIEKQRNYIEL